VRLFSGRDTRERAIHQRHLRNKSFNYLLAGARALNATLQAAGTAAVLYLSCTYPLPTGKPGGRTEEVSGGGEGSRELYQNEKNTSRQNRATGPRTINISFLSRDAGHLSRLPSRAASHEVIIGLIVIAINKSRTYLGVPTSWTMRRSVSRPPLVSRWRWVAGRADNFIATRASIARPRATAESKSLHPFFWPIIPRIPVGGRGRRWGGGGRAGPRAIVGRDTKPHNDQVDTCGCEVGHRSPGSSSRRQRIRPGPAGLRGGFQNETA